LVGIFGEKIGRALQNNHKKNGATFYSEVNVTELTVCRIFNNLFEIIFCINLG
jgi:hypothetical protein